MMNARFQFERAVMTKSKTLTLIPCLLLTASILVIAPGSHAPQAASAKKVRRAVEQSRLDELKRHNLDLNNLRAPATDGEYQTPNFDQSIFTERRSPQSGHRYSSSATLAGDRNRTFVVRLPIGFIFRTPRGEDSRLRHRSLHLDGVEPCPARWYWCYRTIRLLQLIFDKRR